jgi:hypothetical protein
MRWAIMAVSMAMAVPAFGQDDTEEIKPLSVEQATELVVVRPDGIDAPAVALGQPIRPADRQRRADAVGPPWPRRQRCTGSAPTAFARVAGPPQK